MRILPVLMLAFTGLTCVAQFAPFSCIVASDAPLVRASSAAELLGEVRIECTGSSGTIDFDIRVNLNNAFAGRVTGGLTDAYLINDDPATPVLGQNVIRGTLEGTNQLRFRIPGLAAPGAGRAKFRVVNLRAETPPPSAGTPSRMLAFVSGVTSIPFNNSEATIGYVVPGSRFSLLNAGGAPVSGVSFVPGTTTYRVRFQETFPLAFRRRNAATSVATPTALAAQANYGQEYGTESGFYFPALGVIDGGLATQGTRLVARFTNLPAGATIRMGTAQIAGTVAARLVATDSTGAGDYSAITPEQDGSATLPVANGEARAVWEVLESSSTAIESAEFAVAVTVNSATAQMAGASGQLGPIGGTAIPRFGTVSWVSTLEGGANFVQPPQGISFAHTIGNAAPAAITIPIDSNGQAVAFTASAASGGFTAGGTSAPANWLSVSPGSGIAPQAISASVNPSGLAPGTYGGSIFVASPNNTETIFVLLTVRSGAAGGDAANCEMAGLVPPVVRSNGLSERLGDIVFSCNAGQMPSSTDLVLTSNIPLTSGTNAVAVLVNEPSPFAQVVGTNLFYGVNDGGQIRIPNIQIPAAAPGEQFTTFRVVNVLGNVARAGLSGTSIPSTVPILTKLSNLSLAVAESTQAFVQNGLEFGLLNGSDVASAITGSGTWQLRFREGFSTAFQRRNVGTTTGDPAGLFAQDVPGAIYNTETGFYSPGLLPNGLASQGTRLHVKFTGIPAGATITVPTTETVSAPAVAKTQLVQTDASGAGAFVAVPGTSTVLTPSNGTATATWEVLNANLFSLDTMQYAVQVNLAGGTIGVAGFLSPLSTVDTASDSAPMPRFATSSTPARRCLTLPCLRLPAFITLNSTGIAPVTNSVSIDSDANPAPWTASVTVSWLRLLSAGGVTPGSLTVSADPTGLAPGTYQTTIAIGEGTIPVTFNVGGSGGAPGILIDAGPVHFTYASGTTPSPAQVTIGGTVGISILASADAPWLQATAAGGVLQLAITGSPLPPGEYDALVTLSASGAANQFKRVHATVLAPSNTGSLSGRVRNMRPGVTVEVRYGATTAVATPDANGFYSIGSLPASGSFAVVPLGPAGFNFVPGLLNYSTLPVTNADFVATPAVAIGTISPASGQTAAQTFQFQFTDATGWQNLSVVNVLINNYLDGRGACYIAYSVSNNVLYLVPDTGGGLLPGLVMNGSGSTGNSQCTITGAGSSAAGSGNTLTLTLNVTFSTTQFSGNKVIYLAARNANDNTGWETRGTRQVPGGSTQFPAARAVTPASGSGASRTFTFTFDDANAGTNLQTVWALINTAVDGRQACYAAYYRPGNQLYLYPDNGDGTQATSIALTGTNTISNSQCTISATGSSVQVSGGRLTLTLPVSFSSSFAGPKGIWTAAQTMNAAQTSAWEALGNWVVP